MWQLSHISSSFAMMIAIIVLVAQRGSTQLVGQLCLLYGMCKKGKISFNMRWWHYRKLVSFSLKSRSVIGKTFLVTMHPFLSIDQLMQISSWRFKIGRIFVIVQLSRFQFNNKKSGRSNEFLLHKSCHPPLFMFSIMDKYIILFQIQLKIVSNMKLQLAISLDALA